MKVPHEWLEQYVDIELEPVELAERLTYAGLEVEALRFVGLPPPTQPQDVKISGLEWDREKVVVGAIEEIRTHPDADRLVLAEVDDGSGTQTVVTGAPNLFPFKGRGPLDEPLKVALGREGARLYNAYEPERPLTTIRRARIRGVESSAVVCSERELGISDDHSGVILLDPDAVPGTPLAEYMGDVVFDIAITPNQARNACVLGAAREVAAVTGKSVREPDFEFQAEGPPIQGQASIEIREPEMNPRFVLALIGDVQIGPSPYWMQRRLVLSGVRPINNIVDLTAYVMLELGQPLHAFDYDVLVERAGKRPPTIITRFAKPGESLTTLDGETRTLQDFNVLVCDTAGVLSLAGIMGGEESKVTEETRNVLLEGAAWNFINVRRTMQAQKMDSEAGYRFSRGVHPALPRRAVGRAVELMRRHSGGVIARGLLDEYPLPAEPVQVELPLERVRRLLGITLSAAEVTGILESLQFQVKPQGDSLRVTVPDSRLDIGTGVVGQADLVEEIARIYGYDRIPEQASSAWVQPRRVDSGREGRERVRRWLAQAGLQEIVTYRMTTPQREAMLTQQGTSNGDTPYVALANPIASDRTCLRRTLLAGALETVALNLRHRERVGLFEIGPVFLPSQEGPLPSEPQWLAVALTGPREEPHWAGADQHPLDFFDFKGVLEGLVSDLHLDAVAFEPARHPSYHPARCARLLVKGKEVGVFGELHPQVRERFDLPGQSILLGEFDLAVLLEEAPSRHQVEPIAVHPPVLEDLALVVDEGVTVGQVTEQILSSGRPLVKKARVFDIYRGEPVPGGKKSLAFSVTYQADTNLTDDQVAEARQRIVRHLQKNLGAQLRGEG